MLTWPAGVKVFVCTRATDMRCGFDSLVEQVRRFLGEDPLGGSLFVFRNKRGDRLKILYWDGTGFWICAKRLEKGTFRWPMAGDGGDELDSAQLLLLLGGLDLKQVQPRGWYGR